jgi:phage tail-like protein
MSNIESDFQGSWFSLELGGLSVGTFTGCSGLGIEFKVVELKQSDQKGRVHLLKVPGNMTWGEVVMKRGFTTDNKLYDWFKETVAGSKKTQFRSGSIIVHSRDAADKLVFEFDSAFPSKLSVTDLKAGDAEAMVEEVTIHHQGLKWTAP